MRRGLTFFLLVAAIASAGPAATAARPKGASSRTFYMVAGSEDECALSASSKLADPGHGCGTWDDAATGMVLGSEPVWLPALDGLPLRLDAGRAVQGTVRVHSRYLLGYVVPGGAGVAQLEVTVAGVVRGEEVTLGSVRSEPYVVTPDRMEYDVEFTIEPDPALADATLTELRLGLEVLGPNAQHNLYYADGRSALTLPLTR